MLVYDLNSLILQLGTGSFLGLGAVRTISWSTVVRVYSWMKCRHTASALKSRPLAHSVNRHLSCRPVATSCLTGRKKFSGKRYFCHLFTTFKTCCMFTKPTGLLFPHFCLLSIAPKIEPDRNRPSMIRPDSVGRGLYTSKIPMGAAYRNAFKTLGFSFLAFEAN